MVPAQGIGHCLKVRGQAGSQSSLERTKKGQQRSHARIPQQQHIEGHFVITKPRNMWRYIKAITDYKSTTSLTSHDAALLDALK